MTPRQPTFYLPHGGGPCFFMDWNPPDTWTRMGDFLRGLAATLPARPCALLVVSAHWEAPVFTVGSGATPALIYDYSGFPAHTYQLRYDAPGDQARARTIRERLSAAGIAAAEDSQRGFDHGVFIPLKLVFPDADIPIVTLSLKLGLNPAEHLTAGRVLASLRDEGVLIIGSGMSFHNMRAYGDPAFGPVSAQFDQWLSTTLANADPVARDAALAAWAEAPAGRLSHPREEHLLPLMVAAGAADGEPGMLVFSDSVMQTKISGYRFG